MDPALERLGGGTGCTPTAAACPDQLRFQRLASELASATALPAAGPAATIGAAAIGLTFGTTITDIDQAGEHWRRGSRGSSPDGLASGRNASPMPVLVWNRVEARKGLPFGFELGIDLAQGLNTSFWTPGLWLKWALFEGFDRRYGALPDLALRAGWSRSVGSSQLAVQVGVFDLALSRSLVVAHTWSLTPFVDAQVLLTDVDSSSIDLTPAIDAFGACAPDPASPPEPGVAPSGEACSGTEGGQDFASGVAFDDLTQVRPRLAGGAELRWAFWRTRLSLHYDLLAPELPAASGGDASGLRQLAFDVTLGAVL